MGLRLVINDWICASPTVKKDKPVTPTEETKLSPTLITAAVIVPVIVLIAVVVAVVFLVRRYEVTKTDYMKYRDDITSIVTNEQ